jgi:hypothetical protein
LVRGSPPLLGLTIVLMAILVTSCSASHSPRRRSLLVVGDSVAAQAAGPLVKLAPAGTTVSVDAVLPGSAPCDWAHGFTDPFGGGFYSFTDALRKARPEEVVFMFTGNPGLSGPAAGCVDPDNPYTLSQLLATYQTSLTEMANQAVRSGATVYFEAPPPRNPEIPVGYNSLEQMNLGFQGAPEMARFYQELVATKDSPRWRYEDKAAVAVSTPDLSWEMFLPCEAWDSKLCVDGEVQIRAGGIDAVHLDTPGCGGIRFAIGIEEDALGAAPPDPASVAAAATQYGWCQEPIPSE